MKIRMVGVADYDNTFLTCPFVICEACDKPIEDARGGMAVFSNVGSGEVCAVHKAAPCYDIVARRLSAIGDGSYGDRELTLTLDQLLQNSGVPVESMPSAQLSGSLDDQVINKEKAA